MEDSLFTKIDESFVCENCGERLIMEPNVTVD